MKAEATFSESAAEAKVGSVGLAHLSIELGHFYSPDLQRDTAFFVDHFRRIGRWSSAARAACQETLGKKTARISTCVLIDDYFGDLEPPKVIIPKLLDAARESGLAIDYIVRESGCADLTVPGDEDGLSPADLVMARLVEDPPPNTTGARPPVQQTGWLCNGQRSPSTDRHEAMKGQPAWKPPAENAAVNHSIFADIELWSDGKDGRIWSCAMLAAVWQLLRLGVLRDNGRPVAVPQPLPASLPEDWRSLPMVLKVDEQAQSFSAYRATTICAPLFLPVENAVRIILQQVAVQSAVLDTINARAAGEKLVLPAAVVDRLEYLFVDTGPVRGAAPG